MTHKKQDTGSDVEAKLFALADDLNNVVTREHQILQDELGQISTLVEDAVIKLSENFDSVSKLSTSQTKLMLDIMSRIDGADSESKRKTAIAINSEISTTSKAVMRALQFDDIVQQLTAHSCHRAKQMELLFSSLAERLEGVRDIDQIQAKDMLDLIAVLREDVARYRNALEKSNPVKQTSINEGNIELF